MHTVTIQFDCCYAFIVPATAVRATFETWGGGGGGGVTCCCMMGQPAVRVLMHVKLFNAGWCYDLCLGQQSCCPTVETDLEVADPNPRM